jgi:hypothetical protein
MLFSSPCNLPIIVRKKCPQISQFEGTSVPDCFLQVKNEREIDKIGPRDRCYDFLKQFRQLSFFAQTTAMNFFLQKIDHLQN